jgi:tetratricopeptide (TPR) repeat protein
MSGYSQDVKVIEQINSQKYQEAVDAICHEGEMSKIDVQSLSSLAYCYVMLHDYQNAEIVYSEITSRKKFEPSNYKYLGEVLIINQKYKKAKQCFQKFLDVEPDSFFVGLRIDACDSLLIWENSPSEYSVENNKQINSEYDEKSAKFIDNSLVYVSNSVSEELRSNLDLSLNEVKVYKSFDGDSKDYFSSLNEKYSCGALDYCADRDLLALTLREKTKYLYEWNFSNSGVYLATPNSITSLLKLEWEDMPEGINLAQPAFSNNGRRLYFVSDMQGGYGANDIWYSDYKDSKWQIPVNAGDKINTKGNELFPVVYGDTLFFSTDGKPGYGNLDIFISINGGYPINMRSPINSVGNDYSFQIKDKYSGCFTSNRSDASIGMNDIFSWTLPNQPGPDIIPIPDPEIVVFDSNNFNLNPLFFGSEKKNISEEYSVYLQQIVDTLKQYPDLKLNLIGHSDARGSLKYSEKLAFERVQTVANALVDLGVSKDRLEVVSAGITKDQQVDGLNYHVQVGYSKNAGAELWFQKKLGMKVVSFKDKEYTAYAVGSFSTKDAAKQLKKQTDAKFNGVVIASRNGKRLPDLYYSPNRRVEMKFMIN